MEVLGPKGPLGPLLGAALKGMLHWSCSLAHGLPFGPMGLSPRSPFGLGSMGKAIKF